MKKNLWDHIFRDQDLAIGKRFRRTLWPPETHTYFTVTRVQLKSFDERYKGGNAWGLFTWRGKAQAHERRITSTRKREWKVVRELPPYKEPDPDLSSVIPYDQFDQPYLNMSFQTKHPVPNGFYSEPTPLPYPQIIAEKQYLQFDPKIHRHPQQTEIDAMIARETLKAEQERLKRETDLAQARRAEAEAKQKLAADKKTAPAAVPATAPATTNPPPAPQS